MASLSNLLPFYFNTPGYPLPASDLESTQEIESAVVGQAHALAIADVVAGGEVLSVSITTTHVVVASSLAADASIESTEILRTQPAVPDNISVPIVVEDAVGGEQTQQALLADVAVIPTFESLPLFDPSSLRLLRMVPARSRLIKVARGPLRIRMVRKSNL